MTLLTVLRRWPDDCRPQDIADIVSVSAGGFSGALIWRIKAPRGLFCLRRWPKDHPAPHRLRAIHDMIREIAKRCRIPLALPLATIDRSTSFVTHDGHLWELCPWLEGEADLTETPTLARVAAAMTALAEFHLAAEDALTRMTTSRLSVAPSLRQRLEDLERADRDFHDLVLRIRKQESHISEIGSLLSKSAARFLKSAAPAIRLARHLAAEGAAAKFTPIPCLRDVWRQHVLFLAEEVTGIIDYEALSVGHVAMDIARLLSSLAEEAHPAARHGAVIARFDEVEHSDARSDQARELWAAGLAAYQDIRPLNSDDHAGLAGYRAASAVLSGMQWLRWIYMEERKFDDPAAVFNRFLACEARLHCFLSSPFPPS